METRVFKDSVGDAADIIRCSGLVAVPTETVYGLAANGLDTSAVEKIYEVKGRPAVKPLSLMVSSPESMGNYCADVPEQAVSLAERFWPGPLTMIFRKKKTVPKETTGGLDTVAVRFPSHPVARAFIKESGGFIAAPSANISGRPSPTSGSHVLEDMNGRIDMIIDSGKCDIGLESTIIDLTCKVPMMLRPGYVSEKMLSQVIGEVQKDPAVFGVVTDDNMPPRAPGMKYRHYAPQGVLTVISGNRDDVIRFITERIEDNKEKARIGVLTCSADAGCYSGADLVADIGDSDNENVIASNLYDALRKCDDENIDIIYSEEFNTPQLGAAIMNRLIKAAGHNVQRV